MIGISIIQIAEFIMHLDPKCKSNINKYGSMLGMLSLLFIQPLFSILSNLHTKKKISKEIILQIILWIIYVLYIIHNIICLNHMNGVQKRIVLEIVN